MSQETYNAKVVVCQSNETEDIPEFMTERDATIGGGALRLLRCLLLRQGGESQSTRIVSRTCLQNEFEYDERNIIFNFLFPISYTSLT